MTDPRAWCDQVDARINAATDGPWERDRTYPLGHAGPYLISVRSPHVTVVDGLATSDAELIAHARTDLPAATAALRAVLDLHPPCEGFSDNLLCLECLDGYPCPTVVAITTALKDV